MEGDFLGRAALENADRPIRLLVLACKLAEPLIGGPVARAGREIGFITASGWSPFLDQGVVYVRLADASDATLGPVEVRLYIRLRELPRGRSKPILFPRLPEDPA